MLPAWRHRQRCDAPLAPPAESSSSSSSASLMTPLPLSLRMPQSTSHSKLPQSPPLSPAPAPAPALPPSPSRESFQNDKTNKAKEAAAATIKQEQQLHCDYYDTPTLLSRLILHQKYTSAQRRLLRHPHEARVWVCRRRPPPPPPPHRQQRRLETTKETQQDTTTTTTKPKTAAQTTATTAAVASHYPPPRYPKVVQNAPWKNHRRVGSRQTHKGPASSAALRATVYNPHAATPTSMPSTPPPTHTPPDYSYRMLPLHSAMEHLALFSYRDNAVALSSSKPNRGNSTTTTATTTPSVLAHLLLRLIAVYPDACATASHRGHRPLHQAVRYGASVTVIVALLRAAPTEGTHPDGTGRRPLDYLRAAVTAEAASNSNHTNHTNHNTNRRPFATHTTSRRTTVQTHQSRVAKVLHQGTEFWETVAARRRCTEKTTTLRTDGASSGSMDDATTVWSLRSLSNTMDHENTTTTNNNKVGCEDDVCVDSTSVHALAWSQLETKAYLLERLLAETLRENQRLLEDRMIQPTSTTTTTTTTSPIAKTACRVAPPPPVEHTVNVSHTAPNPSHHGVLDRAIDTVYEESQYISPNPRTSPCTVIFDGPTAFGPSTTTTKPSPLRSYPGTMRKDDDNNNSKRTVFQFCRQSCIPSVDIGSGRFEECVRGSPHLAITVKKLEAQRCGDQTRIAALEAQLHRALWCGYNKSHCPTPQDESATNKANATDHDTTTVSSADDNRSHQKACNSAVSTIATEDDGDTICDFFPPKTPGIRTENDTNSSVEAHCSSLDVSSLTGSDPLVAARPWACSPLTKQDQPRGMYGDHDSANDPVPVDGAVPTPGTNTPRVYTPPLPPLPVYPNLFTASAALAVPSTSGGRSGAHGISWNATTYLEDDDEDDDTDAGGDSILLRAEAQNGAKLSPAVKRAWKSIAPDWQEVRTALFPDGTDSSNS